MTTSNEEIINGKIPNLVPSSYEKKSTPKEAIDYSRLYLSDIRTFGNDIGLITNYSSTFFSMLPKFEKGSAEYEKLWKRLYYCNAAQSFSIDRGKGIEVFPTPKHFGDWTKILESDNEETKKQKRMNNELACLQRPYFFRYVYKHQNTKYINHISKYKEYGENVGIKDFNFEDEKIKYYFERYSPLFDSNSVMNNLCHHLENKIQEIKEYHNDFSFCFPGIDEDTMEKVKHIYRQWKELKKRNDYDEESVNVEIRKIADLSAIKSSTLAKCALMINSNFAISCFGSDVVSLFKSKRVEIPVLDKDGEIEFSGKKYSLIELEIYE